MSGLSSISIFLANIYTTRTDSISQVSGQAWRAENMVYMLKTWCPCCMSNPEDYIHFLHCKKNSKQLPGIAALIKDSTNTQEHPLRCLIWRNSTLDTSGCWLACVCRHARSNHGCTIPTSGNWMGSSFARLSGQIMVWSFHDVVWRDLALLPASGIP